MRRLPKRYVLIAASALVLWACGRWLAGHPTALASGGVGPLATLNQVAARFGQNDTLFVVVSPTAPEGDLFTPARLAAIKTLTKSLGDTGLCKTVIDFMSMPLPVVTAEETTVDPLVAALPTTREAAQQVKQTVLAEPIAAGQLIARGGREALILCPLVDPVAGWPKAEALLRAQPGGELALIVVGPLGIGQALSHDLRLSGILVFAVALPIALILSWLERRYGRRFKVWGALTFLPLAASVSAFGWHAVQSSPTPLRAMLGPNAAAADHALDAVTSANETLLIDVTAALGTTEGLQSLAQYCAELARIPGAVVRCPTQVFEQLSASLTGDASLPETPEQLGALWFFAQSRHEVASLLTPDRRHALVRVTMGTPPTHASIRALVAAGQKLVASGHAHGIEPLVAGLPIANAWLQGLLGMIIAALALGAFVAWWLGRTRKWGSVPLGAGWVAASVVAAPIGIVSVLLLTLGAWTLFASLGATGISLEDPP